jgi:hypothetical protein
MKKVIIVAGALAFMMAACKTTSPTTASDSKPKEETKKEQSKGNDGGVVITPAPKSDCGNPSYAMDIKIIFANNCVKCHGETAKGGYSFNSINEIRRAAKNGDFLGTIKYKAGYAKMPKNAPQLDDKSIATIECWINTGMKE